LWRANATEQALAKLRHHRVKASEAVVAKALEGDWRPEHLLVLQLAWENWQHLQLYSDNYNSPVATIIIPQ
jgi:hypothetical protein